jgi:hypothetical protein
MPTMQFYPASDLFDPLWVPTGDWGTWHARRHSLPAELQPRAEMLAVSEFHDRGFKIIVACPCGWEGELRTSRQRTVVERLAVEYCDRCGGQGLDLVEIRPPAETEGLALELADDTWDGVDWDPGLAFDALPPEEIEPDPGWPGLSGP